MTALCCFGTWGELFAQKEGYNENYWYTSTAARNLEAGHEMMVTPLLADVKVQPVGHQVFGEDRFYYVDIEASDAWKSQSIEQLKRQALFDFAKEFKADVIVGALISAQTVDDNKDGVVDRVGKRYKVRITISGYPANYVNFRNASQEDAWIKDQMFRGSIKPASSATVASGQKTVVVE